MKTLKPKLRFPEFYGNWEAKKLGDLTNLITKGTTPSKFVESGIKYVKIECLSGDYINLDKCLFIDETTHSKELKRSILNKNDILFAIAGATIGKCCIVTDDVLPANTNQALAILRFKEGENIQFTFQVLNSSKMKKYILDNISIGAQPNLNLEQMGNFVFFVPNPEEQTKIANFLTVIDEKNNLLKEKKRLLEQYKKGVMKQLFNQEIRFKNDDGSEFEDWEYSQLNEYLYEPKVRNYEMVYSKAQVLSVSGECGIVNQIQHLGRSYAGESVANYHIVRNNDIVYTKSPLKANPYGIIKLNKGDAGIVSTLYAVYGCNENLHGLYLDYYFQLDDNLNKYLRPLVRKGAKNDMKINNSHVLSGYIWIPSLQEQLKITSFLSDLDTKIDVISKQIDASQEYKKGLLQQLFC